MKRIHASASAVLLLLVAACGGGGPAPKTPKASSGSTGTPKEAVSAEVSKGYNDALQAMVAHDKANDWNDATCTQIAKQFLDAAAAQKSKGDLPEAVYNAGLAYQRCNKDADAKKQFEAALAISQKFHRARTQMALYDLKERGDAAIEPVIGELQQAVRDAEFQNVEALVNLATLYMKRRSTNPDQDGANDFERAKKNLQRALAIDDGYQPAFNQLALYYLEMARIKAGRGGKRKAAVFTKTKKADSQMLDLAALVCSQAIRKNPNYAAIHNTAGLIQVEQQDINGAVREFQTATKIDPTFFEAQMNFAAINLSFRGFKAAEDAYRAAIKMHPNDYEAHLGLALALRGQINDSNWDKNVTEAQAELDKCKQLAPDRAETLYNEAILTQEYKAKGGETASAVPMLEQAATIYDNFVARAQGEPAFADAVKRAKERSQDIRDTVKFIKEGQTAAAIEAARQEKEQGAPAEEGEAPAEGDQGAAPPAGSGAPPAPPPPPAAPAPPKQ
jgi:Tfp pilus assembly protein PilF